MKPLIVGALLGASLLFAPLAYADSVVTPIGDPYTDTLQLWESIASSIEYIAQETSSTTESALSVLQHLASNLPHAKPPAAAATSPQQTASLAAAVASFETTDTVSDHATTFQNIGSANSEPPSLQKTTSSQTTQLLSDPPPAFDAAAYITQPELTAQLLQLSTALVAKFNTPATSSVPEYIAADGNAQVPYAALSNIGQLSNVTITNPTFSGVTTSNIPEGSNLYYTDARVLSLLSGTPATTTFGAGISATYLDLTSSSATSTFANGISLSEGCFSINGTCIGAGGGGSGTVTSVATNATLTGGPITTSGTLGINLSNANNWTGLQTFQNASTTLFSAYGPAYFGATATSTFDTAGDLTLAGNLTVNSTATSTFAGGINATYLNLTGSSATSTAANGINLSQGCFSVSGTCIGSGGSSFQNAIGGSFTVESGNSVSTGNLISLLADGNVAPAGSASAGGMDFGTPVLVSGSINGLSLGAATFLSSTSYVLTYQDTSNLSKLTTVACSVSGTTVTCGTRVVVSNSSGGATVTDLSSTSYALTYADNSNSNKLTTVACTVSGTTVTCGTPVVASNSTSAFGTTGAATFLSSTSYALTYADSTNSSELTTVACSVSGTTVTCGTPVVASNSTSGLGTTGAATFLSSTSYALTYADSTNSSKLTTVACSVSGTTVTCGTPVVASNNTGGLGTGSTGAATFLSSTSYVLTYKDSSNSSELTTVACSVSGTTVTCGTRVVVSNSSGGATVTDLSSTSYALTYADTTGGTKLTTVVCSVSGTTVTCGTSVVVSNSTNGLPNIGIADLSSTSYAMAYKDSTNASKFATAACSVSGTTVTCGTPVVASNSTNGSTATVTDLGSTSYVLTYSDSTNNSKLTTAACSVSGTTVTCGTPVVVSNSTGGPANGATTDLSSTSYVLTYKDVNAGSELTTIAGSFISLTASYPVGVASTAGSAGQSVNIVADGVASGFSGLTVGTVYYANTDGTITSIFTPERLGIAISSTQIELSPAASGPTTSTLNFGDAVFANNFRITEAQNGLQALLFLNQSGTQIASLDENGNLSITGQLTAANAFASVDATTTASSTLAASFTDASQMLQDAIGAIGETAIRMLGDAVQATFGIFDTVIAKVAYIETLNTQNLCVSKSDGSEICVTGDQLASVFGTQGTSTSGVASSSPETTGEATDTPPQIQINGDNPAIIQVGTTYNDLGATITGPTADLNLGIETYLNGTLTSNIVIDTSAAATDTIDYVATDQNGLTSTSTRTVIIEPAALPTPVMLPTLASTTAPSIVPSNDASTTTDSAGAGDTGSIDDSASSTTTQ